MNPLQAGGNDWRYNIEYLVVAQSRKSAMKMANATIGALVIVNGKQSPKEGMLEAPGSFDLKSITMTDEKPDIQSPVFIVEEGAMRIHFNQMVEEYKVPDTL